MIRIHLNESMFSPKAYRKAPINVKENGKSKQLKKEELEYFQHSSWTSSSWKEDIFQSIEEGYSVEGPVFVLWDCDVTQHHPDAEKIKKNCCLIFLLIYDEKKSLFQSYQVRACCSEMKWTNWLIILFNAKNMNRDDVSIGFSQNISPHSHYLFEEILRRQHSRTFIRIMKWHRKWIQCN